MTSSGHCEHAIPPPPVTSPCLLPCTESMMPTKWAALRCCGFHLYSMHSPMPCWPHVLQAFLRGRFDPFLTVPSVPLVTTMGLLTNSRSQPHLWGRQQFYLHFAWTWLLNSPRVSPAFKHATPFHQPSPTKHTAEPWSLQAGSSSGPQVFPHCHHILLLVTEVSLSARMEDMASACPGFLTFPCLVPRLHREGGAHL